MSVPVNRGWVEVGLNRAILPEIKAIDGEMTVTGTVISPEIRALTLSDEFVNGQVWDKFDLQRYMVETELAMQPILVLQKNLRRFDFAFSVTSFDI